MISWKLIKEFLIISKYIKVEWNCCLGCPHTYNRPIYRWYIRLYRWIKEKLRPNTFTFPRFSKNVPPFPALFDSSNIKSIPMTEPTGLYYFMRYVSNKEETEPPEQDKNDPI